MSSSTSAFHAMEPNHLDPTDLATFTTTLLQSRRIMSLLGAGLSASSGLPTFRGPGGMWRRFEATSLATPGAFARDPCLFWQFYSWRRSLCFSVKPNAAHFALASLASTMERKGEVESGNATGFMTLSQNVDGLCARAGHDARWIKNLHGSLSMVKCSSPQCGYEAQDFTDPITPALAIPKDDAEAGLAKAAPNETGVDSSGGSSSRSQEARDRAQLKKVMPGKDISDAVVPLPEIRAEDLPHCPKCKTNLLRPGVVLFGEQLPLQSLREADAWIVQGHIDLMLVIGTSSRVYPAAGYVEYAREKGARVVVINMDPNCQFEVDRAQGDLFFYGDAAVLVPKLLEPLIGDVSGTEEVDVGLKSPSK